MIQAGEFNFFGDTEARRSIRSAVIFGYFLLFQFLILLQKPFLQFEFAVVFYLTFGALFARQMLEAFVPETGRTHLLSYLFDFAVLAFFMRHFPYLSSFILVLQLFLLFLSSFDLDFAELALLGFVSSLGASWVNFISYQPGSIQNILSLALYNLSYLSVIVVSRQLRQEFSLLQTDLSSTRRKWKSQEQFLNKLIEKLPFGLAVADRNNEFVLRNPYLGTSIGLSPEKLRDLIQRYHNRGPQSQADIIFTPEREGERRILNFDSGAYHDDAVGENLNIYLIKDVTAERLLESQLKQSEKLAAVGQLAAGIAHEIRNPLAGISGSIQLLSQDSADPTQKKLMQIVLKEIDRLNLLITEFLDYAKPEKTPDTEISLAQVLEDVVFTTRRHPEAGAGFEWKMDIQEAVVLGFSEKLKQALLNIVINAVQAMKDSPQPRLDIRLHAEGRQAVLSIRDYGSGMSEETRKKMFEPFHTTKPKGTGLGLAITHKILEIHRAQVEVKSELGAGTEFIIKLPLVRGG